MQTCELCNAKDEIILHNNKLFRIILAQNEANYPAICRVILNQHATEMTDLSEDIRNKLMSGVWQVERVLRKILLPDKINLACLGNQVAHLHWHIIPRFTDDAHFPDSIWANPKRNGIKHSEENLAKLLIQHLSNIQT